MEYINAPWRAKYVRHVIQTDACIFCQALENPESRDAHILHRGRHNFVIQNKFPYTPGHLLVAPLKHLDSPEKASLESAHELWDMTVLCLKILREVYSPKGFNTGMNLGQCAGAGVTGHYHTHIVPRWPGDSNFMPIVGNTKVVIETLDSTYEQLRPLFQKQE